MSDKYDDLGDRMKRYEAVSNSQKLIPGLPLYARIDGRHFSKFTKGFGYPYPELGNKCGYEMTSAMRFTADALCKEFNCALVETHSDEISLAWEDITKAPFDGEYFKLVSNLASYATSVFLCRIRSFICDKLMKGEYPSFDCRVFQVPNMAELANLFVWRQNDCMRGCLNQYAQQFFSHKQLDGKSGAERHQMCLDAGHDYDNNVDAVFKYGYFCRRENYEAEIPEEFRTQEQIDKGVTTVIRSRISQFKIDFPISKILNKVQFLFYDEGPVMGTTRLEHGHRPEEN